MAFAIFNQRVEGQRKHGGRYVGGVWYPGVTGPIVIGASVQPSPGKDLELLPEGRRTTGAYTLYAVEPLVVEDVFQLFGEAYEVLHAESWQNGIIPHYKAVAAKMQAPGVL